MSDIQKKILLYVVIIGAVYAVIYILFLKKQKIENTSLYGLTIPTDLVNKTGVVNDTKGRELAFIRAEKYYVIIRPQCVTEPCIFQEVEITEVQYENIKLQNSN